MTTTGTIGDGARRLDPRTVLLRAVTQLPSLLFGVPVAAMLSSRSVAWPLLLAAAGIALALFGLWLHWRSFSYRIGADEVLVRQGIVNVQRRSIPLARIQDVSISRTPVARLLGLATVRLETGGGEGEELLLDAVSVAEAARLRDLLRTGTVRSLPTDTAGDTRPTERALFAMPPARVLHMGAYRFSLLWLAAIATLWRTLDRIVDLDPDIVLARIGAARTVAAHWLSLVAVLGVGALLLAAGVVTGLIATVLTQWGFDLTLADGRFRRVRGLLTRTEVVIAASRVQLALVERGMVSGRRGWASLRFQTLGGSDDAGGRQDMAPFARDAEIAAVVAAAGLPAFDPQPLRPVARGHVLRAVLLRAGAPALVLLVAGLAFPPAWAGLLLLPVPVGCALLARRYHRYALVGDSVQVARGVLRRREWTVPVDAIQAVSISQDWLQRRLGLATLRIDTAGAGGLHRPDIVDVARADATRMAAELLHRTTEETLSLSRVPPVVTIPIRGPIEGTMP